MTDTVKATAVNGSANESTGATTTPLPSEEQEITKPVAKVFRTVELLEHILHYLSSSDIVQTRQLNCFTKSLVLTSKKLHKSIWTNSRMEILNGVHPKDDSIVRYHGFWSKVLPRHYKVCQINEALSTNNPDFNFESDVCAMSFWFNGIRFLRDAESNKFCFKDYVIDANRVDVDIYFSEDIGFKAQVKLSNCP